MLRTPACQIAVRTRMLSSHSVRPCLCPRLHQIVPGARSQPQPQTRFSSSSSSPSSTKTQPPRDQGSLNRETFFKTFGRPIAKVFLMAIFTYQLAYFVWVKLEQGEKRAEIQGVCF
ncbi:hypothetical protein F5Y17DRAFT_415894 [Xylariaceae sp. FL0594]|nr:hypothetical protein F5Y17DRAFT_415894 [Xylariaceae sp. FL0594]